ncbi:hypothetical protein VTP01DRAFT_8285 [Rhizomucor pusillus]|uniref:uncharacterized protein n=1 Tax=Rhizomucor pusillus TaxID=4840 RepID=UPI003743C3F3
MTADEKNYKLAAELLLPELERQIRAEKDLWPNFKGLFILNITKKRKVVATWYLLLQGKDVMPLITDDEEKARNSAKGKVRTVKIQVDDSDLINLVTGGMTGIKAYMSGKIKVRGDLMLAQRLEEVFDKANGRERAMEFIRNNEQALSNAGFKAKL